MGKKRVPVLFLGLIAGFICLISNVEAANWYVDKDAVGANNGSSWSNAWASFSRIVWGGGGVKAGDTLYISGGSSSKTYYESLSVGASGSAGSPITIKVGQDSGHNGTVVLDFNSQGDSGSGSAISIYNRSFITISGNYGGSRRIKIQNLRNPNKITDAAAIGGTGTSAGNIIIEYVEVDNCNNGVLISYPQAPIEVRYSKLRFRGDAGVGLIDCSTTPTPGWDFHKIHDNEIIPMIGNAGGGPDGIQCSHGVSIYNNKFKLESVSYYTSGQHPDYIQVTGNYIKIYNNEFVNIADSGIDFDTWSNNSPHDFWVFNNVFRNTFGLDPYPEYIRLYTSNGRMTSVINFKVFNNTFIDGNAGGKNWAAVKFMTLGGASGSGNEIKNNIFYNCGDGSNYFPLIEIDGPSGSFAFDGNIYYHPSSTSYVKIYGRLYTSSEWVAGNEPKGRTGRPVFMSYTAYSAGNDLHIATSDTVALHSGVNLSNYVTTDKDGVSRPQGGGFDIGAYEGAAGGTGGGMDVQPPSSVRILPPQ